MLRSINRSSSRSAGIGAVVFRVRRRPPGSPPSGQRAALRLDAALITLRRHYSSSPGDSAYDSTLENLRVGSHTRVIFQGFTGKQATANARESLAWGTRIVGGVTPGREGEHLGLPVLPSVRKAVETLKPDATGIYVAAPYAAAAIEEAIAAEVPLLVAVAEHIPLHDMLRIHAILKTQSRSRLVGANSPGLISAVGKCRIGFQPLPCFEPGRIGIIARSGTLSYETAASTLRAGLGQSMCIGIGGDILPGTSLREGLQVLAEDADTEGIALIGEIGGEAELEAADWIREYRSRTLNPKPIAALIGGIHAVAGRIMGHSGAFALPGEPSALDKVKALEAAGAVIVNHPSRFGPVLKSILGNSAPGTGPSGATAASQHRGMHTAAARRPMLTRQASSHLNPRTQGRSVHLTQSTAFDMLRQRGIPIVENAGSRPGKLLAVTVNRSTKSPCVVASPTDDVSEAKRFDFACGTTGAQDIPVADIAQHLRIGAGAAESLGRVISRLAALFVEKEAFLLETRIVTGADGTAVGVAAAPRFGFDDAAFRSGRRQADVQALRDMSAEDPAEVGVEGDGIVYIKLPEGNIGTLVNGAGLAMNTVDALADAGGHAANFLDTGGKATSETVKRSFEVILTDPRVKCIFVNIFGGLTRGDMIARGVVMAFRDLQMSVPVVVRIRGTNEEEGQKIVAESGLSLFAYDDFDEAAAKAIELANGEP
ncbi:succinyl-CoA ligase alpha-chain [Durotheca rogersii]|uniref:succinyl-CoA ligase alpha-chain n=1 Tax=Durotheca rogersii TaxID=419775 RepID=UPI00222114DF|nr:succinyl-CoA ligase alpha-chain [Durotheca rogersii]KAI5862679.1 succinyl-CoA ligase alpha-chain [Durotheca rogersii]